MNRRTRGRIPKNTNPTGTRGRGGRNPALGRPTFVDEIIARERFFFRIYLSPFKSSKKTYSSVIRITPF
jgi:hypothetical protein